MTTKTKIWNGAEPLRRLLVPIEALEPFPGNPRRGDVAVLRTSLKRWGQVLPVLVDPSLSEEGKKRIVARHHLVLAAASMSEIEGEKDWTHIAVIEHAFQDEDEARAYLLADNRIPELGGYDSEALAAQLRALRDTEVFTGTGYVTGDVDDALARLAASNGSPLRNGDQRQHRDPSMKELVLVYNADHLAEIEVWLGIISKADGSAGPSETVYNSLRDAAQRANS